MKFKKFAKKFAKLVEQQNKADKRYRQVRLDEIDSNIQLIVYAHSKGLSPELATEQFFNGKLFS